MKFTMDAKELKTMIEKGMAAVNKKSGFTAIRTLYIQTEPDGTVRILGTDLEQFAEIRSSSAYDTSPGEIGIDADDMKLITKMSGEITVQEKEDEKIYISCGKKTVTVPGCKNKEICLPVLDDTQTHVMTLTESWLLDTVTKLVTYTLVTYTEEEAANRILSVFNFNTKHKRVEALDGHRIGMRSLANQRILEETENPFDTVKLQQKCVPVFKKLMNKKSYAQIKVIQDKKYVKIEGADFTYITRRIDGEYFKVEQMLTDAKDYIFSVDRESILSAMNYNCDITKKEEKKPVIFHSENGQLYSYMKTSRYETIDEVETTQLTMSDDLFIGFSPYFLADVFSIIDSDNPVCRGSNSRAPMYIEGEEYSFLILPITIWDTKMIDNMRKHIKQNKVA